MAVKLRKQLPLAVSVLLLWLHFALPTCEAKPGLNRSTQSADENVKIVDNLKARGQSDQDTSSVAARKSIKKPLNMTTERSTEEHQDVDLDTDMDQLPGVIAGKNSRTSIRTREKSTEEHQDEDLDTDMEQLPGRITGRDPKAPLIGPRITLDSVAACGEGLMLFSHHCRKAA